KVVYACTMLALEARGKQIRTAESLYADGKLDAVPAAFVAADAQQCGFCTPGFVVAMRAVFDKNPNATPQQVDEGLAGNICRWGTQEHMGHATADLCQKKGGSAMATRWPEKRRLIGTKTSRIDGPAKSTGRAKYSNDMNRQGMLHGLILRCPQARARLKKIDLAKAEKMPGVKAVLLIAEPTKTPSGETVQREFFYAGDEIAAVAADTEEHARDAIRAIASEIEFQPLEFIVREDDALRQPDKKTVGGQGKSNLVSAGNVYNKGDVDKAFASADAVVQGTYGAAVICHHCLEPHGLVAEWGEGDTL